MSADPSLIADLIRAGVDADLVQRVALELGRASAEREAIEKRRQVEAERSRLYRERGGGAISGELRAYVLARDGFACVYCGARGLPLTCDHVLPVSRGGLTCECNLAACCTPCNSAKRDLTPAEWGGR